MVMVTESTTSKFKAITCCVLQGPLQDSAVWIDETQTLSMLMGRNRATSPMASPDHDDPLGISDEANE